MKQVAAVLAVALVLAACGDNSGHPADPLGRPGIPGGLPKEATAIADAMTRSETIELTDDMMERYVEAVKQLKGVRTPDAALLARYRFNTLEWAQITLVITRSTMRTGFSDSQPRVREQLEEAKKQLADASTDNQRKNAEMKIKMLEAQAKAFGALGDATDLDRKNAEVFARWKDRIQEAGE